LLATAGVDDPAQTLAVLRAVDKLDRLGLEGVERLLGKVGGMSPAPFTKGAQLGARRSSACSPSCRRGRTPAPARSTGSPGGGRLRGGDQGLEHLARIDASCGASASARTGGVRAFGGAWAGVLHRPVWELELLEDTVDERGERVRFGSVGSGGRYDDLVARFTGERVPATGLSFGVSRLAAALRAAGRDAASEARGPVVVIAFDPAMMSEYFALAGELRAAGIAAEVYLGSAGMKAQMKYADRRFSPAAVIMGSDELAAGTVTVKDLDAGRAAAQALKDNTAWRGERPGQVTVPRGELAAVVRGIVGSAA
jgi:histidyl-tRNA synthetase